MTFKIQESAKDKFRSIVRGIFIKKKEIITIFELKLQKRASSVQDYCSYPPILRRS